MKNYGELQQLKGVGRVTAKALATAGFTNLATVAGAEPDELAEGLSTVNARVPCRATDLIKQAKALVNGEAHPAPIPVKRPKSRESTNGEAHSPPEEKRPKPQESTNGEATSWWGSTGLAQLLVKNIGPGLLKAPAFRSALLKRAIQHPPTRALIIRKVVEKSFDD